MAKGRKGKSQKVTPSGVEKAKNDNIVEKENSTSTKCMAGFGKFSFARMTKNGLPDFLIQTSQISKGRKQNRDKPKLTIEEPKAKVVEESNLNQMTNHADEQRKDCLPEVPHSRVQPTTEQLMMARLIDGHSNYDDPNHQKKIGQVMEVTGKSEDAVATALFDAAWDESRAVELLLEDNNHLSAWKETGKKKKTKKTTEGDNSNWDDYDCRNDERNSRFPDPRERKYRQIGPPRMQRRGGMGNQTNEDHSGHDRYTEKDDDVKPYSGRGFRRGNQPPRRGGRGGGHGTRTFSSRQQQNRGTHQGGFNSESKDGFQSRIDTWVNPNEQNSSDKSNLHCYSGFQDMEDRGEGCEGGTGDHRGERSHRGGRSGCWGVQSGTDAFDNAGKWEDDFPKADDWDNEEYTGSLAETKVFTASGAGQKQSTPTKQFDKQPQQQPLPASVVTTQSHQSGSMVANSQRAPGFSPTALVSNSANIPPTYSPPIDLSILLQKPSTQSLMRSPAVPEPQFNQQASDTLKAYIGIGTTSSNTSQHSATQQHGMTSLKDPSSLELFSNNQASAFTSIKSQTRLAPEFKGQDVSEGGQTRSRMSPPSKVPSMEEFTIPPASEALVLDPKKAQMHPHITSKVPAVEMPGGNLGRLDVQFGSMELQFGGSDSKANSDTLTGSSGLKFDSAPVTQDPEKTENSGLVQVMSTTPASESFAPTNKETNTSQPKSSNNNGNFTGSSIVHVPNSITNQNNQQDSFIKSSSTNTSQGNRYKYLPLKSSSVPSLKQTAYLAATRSREAGNGGGNNFNILDQTNNQPSYLSYKASSGYGNNVQSQQYSNNNSFLSEQQQVSVGQSPQYKGSSQHDLSFKRIAAASVQGLANTNTTNAVSEKVSATTASIPNLPPGAAASMLHPQYVAAGLAPPAAFYGLRQPMYGPYGNAGLDNLVAMQRATASPGLHTLPNTGYYDQRQFAAMANREAGSRNTVNLNASVGNSTSAAQTSLGSTSGFGSISVTSSAVASSTGSTSLVDSTSSPSQAPSTGQAGNGMGNTGQHHSLLHVPQQTFNLAAQNAYAAQQMPPGYAYYFGNMGLQPYGTTTPSHMYQATSMTLPGAGASASQFQKSYGANYGSGYETLGQQAGAAGNKEFSGNYSSSGPSKSTGGSTMAGSGTPNGKGVHQYWGNALAGPQLWGL